MAKSKRLLKFLNNRQNGMVSRSQERVLEKDISSKLESLIKEMNEHADIFQKSLAGFSDKEIRFLLMTIDKVRNPNEDLFRLRDALSNRPVGGKS